MIAEGLGLRDGFLNECWSSRQIGEPVLVTLGGGHYAPKANKLGLENNVWIGHMLANHSLPFGSQDNPGILWKQSIDAALASTQKAFPGGVIVCNVEKKSFKGWQRQLIYNHLESSGSRLFEPMRSWKWSKDAVKSNRIRRWFMLSKLIVAMTLRMPRWFVRWVSRRYVAGSTLDDAVTVMKRLESEGACFTIDVLGEEISSLDEAQFFLDEYVRVMKAIVENDFDANLSIKPTAFGLLIDKDKGMENIESLVRQAAEHDMFVRLDMEDHRVTQKPFKLFSICMRKA